MPRPATVVEEQAQQFEEVALPSETLRTARPVIRARVVYLGADRNKSVTWPGQVSVELIEDPEGTAERDDGHRLAREMFKKEYGELAADERAQVDQRKTTRHYREIKEATVAGSTSYDFRLYDARGDLIRARLMPDTAPAHLRGKRFEWVEHIDHLRKFFLAEGANHEREFEILTKPEHMAVLSDYVRRGRRSAAALEAEVKEIQQGGQRY